MGLERTNINENHHGTNLDVYGRETMKYGVLISGIQGLGIEIAKNLILAGVKSVTLHDEGLVDMWDLSSMYMIAEEQIGTNRALASVKQLQTLNNAVKVSTLTTKLTKELLSKFQVVVFTDLDLETAMEFSDFCHEQQPPIPFIKTEVRGLFGNIFCDFGPKFSVTDADGEERHAGIVKQPKVLNFKPLREAIKVPGEFLASDLLKLKRSPILHLAFQALDKFRSELRRFPVAGSEDDAEAFVSIVAAMNENLGDGKLEDLESGLLMDFAYGTRAVLNPMAAMFGGIAGQEVLKAFSRKFHPLFQFFYFDSIESLPSEPLQPSEYSPMNCRYDAQISVFGANLHKKLENTRSFVVGAGALGCEFIKNLSLMGVSSGVKGQLTITDDDLFGESDIGTCCLPGSRMIGHAKSPYAASGAALVNPQFRKELQAIALKHPVCPETDSIFNDSFWENMHVVINAIDNMAARLYIDDRCLHHRKPLLECGTFGAMCNTTMVIPHLTESFRAYRDASENKVYGNDNFVVATSVAMTAGLVCLELYKLIDRGHKLEDYRNTFANLEVPKFSMVVPAKPKVITSDNKWWSWTNWDTWAISGNLENRLTEASLAVVEDMQVLKKVVREGDGHELPKEGDKITVKLVGKLEDGTLFMNKEISMIIDGHTTRVSDDLTQEMISGIILGVMTMRSREVSVFRIEPEYAFGSTSSRQQSAIVPPNARVLIMIELVKVEEGPGKVVDDKVRLRKWKSLYVEHAEVKSMSFVDAWQFRTRLGVQVYGKGVLKPIKTWFHSGVKPELVQKLETLKFKSPMPLQCQLIPILLNGSDCIVASTKGDGLKVGFTTAMVDHIGRNKALDKHPVALVITDSQENVCGIDKVLKRFSKVRDLRINSIAVCGGNPEKVARELKKACDVVVATPRKLMAAVSKAKISLRNVSFLVVHQAEKLKQSEVTDLLEETRADRQILICSEHHQGKESKTVQRLAATYASQAVKIVKI